MNINIFIFEISQTAKNSPLSFFVFWGIRVYSPEFAAKQFLICARLQKSAADAGCCTTGWLVVHSSPLLA
jgi:hypothetical protein